MSGKNKAGGWILARQNSAKSRRCCYAKPAKKAHATAQDRPALY
jgi:hypothetical protein